MNSQNVFNRRYEIVRSGLYRAFSNNPPFFGVQYVLVGMKVTTSLILKCSVVTIDTIMF
jgi:hypothetical protein